jgi:hypothetical protein
LKPTHYNPEFQNICWGFVALSPTSLFIRSGGKRVKGNTEADLPGFAALTFSLASHGLAAEKESGANSLLLLWGNSLASALGLEGTNKMCISPLPNAQACVKTGKVCRMAGVSHRQPPQEVRSSRPQCSEGELDRATRSFQIPPLISKSFQLKTGNMDTSASLGRQMSTECSPSQRLNSRNWVLLPSHPFYRWVTWACMSHRRSHTHIEQVVVPTLAIWLQRDSAFDPFPFCLVSESRLSILRT